MITELTPQQQNMLPVYRDEWLKIGLGHKEPDIEQVGGQGERSAILE